MDAILRIARSYGLYVIEDACEAIGAEFRGKRIGSIGDAGVFAFYPNKQITTGEGGMVVTDSHALAGFCRSARNQGRNEKASWLLHDTLGFNYRIPDINCALGIAQLERIDEILDKRRAVAAQYNLLLHDFGDIPAVLPEGKRSWFVYVLELSGGLKKADRDRILDSLRQQGISAGDYFPPIHLQPLYRDLFGFKPGSLPVTEALSGRTIALPFHSKLTDSEVVRVAQCLMTELAEKVPGRDGEMEKKFRKAVTAFKAKRRTRVA
jgi:perosamine synthetase